MPGLSLGGYCRPRSHGNSTTSRDRSARLDCKKNHIAEQPENPITRKCRWLFRPGSTRDFTLKQNKVHKQDKVQSKPSRDVVPTASAQSKNQVEACIGGDSLFVRQSRDHVSTRGWLLLFSGDVRYRVRSRPLREEDGPMSRDQRVRDGRSAVQGGCIPFPDETGIAPSK